MFLIYKIDDKLDRLILPSELDNKSFDELDGLYDKMFGKYIGKYIGEYYEILIKKVISNNITDIFDKSSSLINNIKEKVLKNKECTKEIFEKLSDDNFWGTRVSVAENLNCPSHVLEKLSNDKDGLVVLEVA